MKNIIEIWRPRYSRRDVLVNPLRVKTGENYVKITKDPTYAGQLLKFNSKIIKQYPTQPNGRGIVVCIPLSAFEMVGEQ